MLDQVHDVDDYFEVTIQAMIDRLERSTSHEQFVYRETELDEMWRVVDIELKQARSGDQERLNELRAIIMHAHDLVGVEGEPLKAADVLRRAKL